MKSSIFYFLVITLFISFPSYAGQKVVFSETKHIKERNIVRNILNSEIIEAKSLSNELVIIGIAAIDLDHNGNKEILAYIHQYPYFCGVEGCWFMIFQKNKNGRWIKILDSIIQEDVELSGSATAGYTDLVLEGKSIWKWNGQKYDFATKIKQ